MLAEPAKLEISDGIATVTLDKPERMNCLDFETCDSLLKALKSAVANPDAKVIVLRGSGKAFCAGGDVKGMFEAVEPEKFLKDIASSIHKVVMEIQRSPKLVIASVNGVATGAGCSIMLACDLKMASDEATFSMWFPGIGLAPGCGVKLLYDHAGQALASEMLLTGRKLTANEALEGGLVNWVVPADKLNSAVKEKAMALSNNAIVAVGRTKELLRQCRNRTLEEQLELEKHFISISGRTEDFREGTGAFVQKRKATFKGR